ncbi:RNA polymerase sigma factor [Sphingobacterium sp. 2149]|uniref:RNA polymerase sigma factor n=1 Tax=Sphingobacterium sp. 2149 TaxID=2817763 RepID=UPI001AE44F71|nr:RNA polymerase sigma-70 factor [Sphingobacterium sp. 2149]MDR6737208.1 RNA polymerase sigma-70 factor (ECF subfamily) [Sphingobacterium sp. 2149]
MSNDVDLLKKIVQKDRDAFEAIYKAYFRKLYILSFRYVRDESIAEELTNDIFMMLWENAGKLTINQSLGAYLSRSVINLSLTYLKKNLRLLERNNEYSKELDLTDEEDQTDSAALYESKLLMIESLLEGLPPQCRKIVIMSKYDKMKQQEIADQLGISIKTVKNHLTIAYDKIRVALAKQKNSLLLLIAFLFFSLGLFVQFIIL